MFDCEENERKVKSENVIDITGYKQPIETNNKLTKL